MSVENILFYLHYIFQIILLRKWEIKKLYKTELYSGIFCVISEWFCLILLTQKIWWFLRFLRFRLNLNADYCLCNCSSYCSNNLILHVLHSSICIHFIRFSEIISWYISCAVSIFEISTFFFRRVESEWRIFSEI